jgi:hypothetical protein
MKRNPMRDGFFLAAGLWTLAMAAGLVVPGIDAEQYWRHHLPNPYDVTTYSGNLGGYWYPPPFAQAIYPLTLLPLSVFAAIFTGAGFAALYAILGKWAWAGLLFPPVWWDLSSGNVNTLIGAAAILSARRPLLALIPGLTKPTAGVIVLWHLARRDWRAVRSIVGAGLGICALSFALSPGLWFSWASTMLDNAGYLGPGYFTIPVPLAPRLLLAILLIWWGARTDRAWVLPVAAWLAIPVLWWTTMAALIAVLRVRVGHGAPRSLRLGWSLPRGTEIARPDAEPGH